MRERQHHMLRTSMPGEKNGASNPYSNSAALAFSGSQVCTGGQPLRCIHPMLTCQSMIKRATRALTIYSKEDDNEIDALQHRSPNERSSNPPQHNSNTANGTERDQRLLDLLKPSLGIGDDSQSRTKKTWTPSETKTSTSSASLNRELAGADSLRCPLEDQSYQHQGLLLYYLRQKRGMDLQSGQGRLRKRRNNK